MAVLLFGLVFLLSCRYNGNILLYALFADQEEQLDIERIVLGGAGV